MNRKSDYILYIQNYQTRKPNENQNQNFIKLKENEYQSMMNDDYPRKSKASNLTH
jgi:hypothetical protein